MSKRVYVTGAAGFIGYHLCKRLVREGYEVSGVDDFNPYYDPGLKRHRAALLKSLGVRVSEADFVPHRFFLESVDVVIHLAAHAGVRHSMGRAAEYIENNVVKTQGLIDDLAYSKVLSKVIYASTSCVMAGNPLPWMDDQKVGHQLNPYGFTKRTNECQFATSSLVNTVGLRFFTVYGPFGRPDMALFSFTESILKGEPITLFNDGNMIRDFTYVDDIVDGIVIALEKTPSGHHVYNLGRGKQVHLRDFVSEIEKNVGRKAEIVLAPRHPADTIETWSDTTKLRALGYEPKVDVADGVRNFVNWYRSYYDA